MTPVAAPFLASSAVLAAAGVAKIYRPDYTARALAVAGLPSHRRVVRIGAGAELAVAVLAVVRPGPISGALVAVAYAGFAGFVGVALWRGWPLSSCGCFGRPDSRPGYLHLVLNLGASVSAVWWAATAPSRIGLLFSAHQPWHGGPLVLVSVVIAGLAYALWSNPAEMVV